MSWRPKATQTFFVSIKKSKLQSPPSRPRPLAFMPPKGDGRWRTISELIHTIPASTVSATRWARPRFSVQT